MPLDMTTQDNFIAEVPENLSFKTVFEPTLFKERKYVINGDTGEYIGVLARASTVLTTKISSMVYRTS